MASELYFWNLSPLWPLAVFTSPVSCADMSWAKAATRKSQQTVYAEGCSLVDWRNQAIYTQNPHCECNCDITSTIAGPRLSGTSRRTHCNQLLQFQTDRNKKLVGPNVEVEQLCSTQNSAFGPLARGIQ